jgi:hypothetical protein
MDWILNVGLGLHRVDIGVLLWILEFISCLMIGNLLEISLFR